MNPILMNKEDVERMCLKSKKLWGAKWRWRSECNKRGFTWQELETKLDNIFRRHEEMLKGMKEKHEQRKSNKQLGTTPKLADTNGSGSGGDPGGQQSDTGEVVGKEVRSKQTEDGTVTTSGTE